MTIRIRMAGTAVSAAMNRGFTLNVVRMRRATLLAAEEAAKEIEIKGRANIASAGRFGRAWRQGFRATVRPRLAGLAGAEILVTHNIRFWKVFQFGKIIRGRPLLWVPLFGLTISARNMARNVGGFFRVNRKNKPPLLFGRSTRKPMYIGLSVVRIRKRFQLIEIVNQVAKTLPAKYRKYFK